MKTRVLALALLSFSLSQTGCGESKFGGNSDHAAGAQPGGGKPQGGQPGSEDPNASLGEPGKPQPGEPEEKTPEQEAIGRCLAAWGTNPFGAQAFTHYRKISAAVSVFGKGGYAIEDTQVTDAPKLILVNAGVGVLGDSNMLLMNPNGWYCIMVNVNVFAKSKVELNCKAALADSQVAVNVGSSAQSTAAVGVNVGSDVKVIRKRSAEAEPGC